MAQNSNRRLNGINPLAYIGTNPYTPPDFVDYPRPPTVNDSKNFEIGTFWLDTTNNPPTATDLWVLVDLSAGLATWIQLGGAITSIVGTHGINVSTVAGVATVAINNAITLGDLTPLAANSGALTVTTGDVIIAAGDLTLPNTNAAGNQGIIKFGGNRWISNFGNSNTFVGQGAGNTTLTAGVANQNVALGAGSLTSITTATANTALGVNTMPLVTSSPSNVAVGGGALASLVSGLGANSAVGVSALDAVTTGDTNSALGFVAGARITTGGGNICIGSASGSFLTTGNDNVFIGEAVGTNGTNAGLTTGSSNVLIGTNSATVYTTNESNNLIILNGGVIGDSNFIRIGSNGGGIAAHTKCFIAGIRGITTDVADAVAVLVDSAGQLGTVSSSERYKENIEDLNEESEDIYRLMPKSFTYKEHPFSTRSIGLIAEEVDEIIPSLVVYDQEGRPDAVKYHDLPVLILNELIKLRNRVDDLEEKLAAIKKKKLS